MSHVPWDLIEHDVQGPGEGSGDVATGDRQVHGQIAGAGSSVRLEAVGAAVECLELMLRQRSVGVDLEADGVAGHNLFIVNERQKPTGPRRFVAWPLAERPASGAELH